MADNQPEDQPKDPVVATTTEPNAGNEPEPKAPKGDEENGDGTEPGGQGAEKRIAELSRLKNRYKNEADHWKNIAAKFATIDSQAVAASANPITTPTTTPSPADAQVEQAVAVLRQRGFATIDDIESIRKQSELRRQWDQAHSLNEQRYNAPGSRFPKYDPEEVERYATDHKIADPNAAYRDMYFDEILDAVKAESKGKPARGVTTEKPTKSFEAGKEPLTLENFRSKLAGPEGGAFYEELAKNPAKFDSLMAELVK